MRGILKAAKYFDDDVASWWRGYYSASAQFQILLAASRGVLEVWGF